MHLKKRVAGSLLAVLMLTALLPAAGALQFQSYAITDGASAEIPAMLDGIYAQTFTTTDAQTVRGYIEHLLFDSSFAAIGGSRYPYTNSQGYWAGKTVSDGTYTEVVSATGCFSYCKFAAQVIYGGQGSVRNLHERAGAITAQGLKEFLQSYAQAGEHIRVDSKHSVTYVSGNDEGFYYLDYIGDQNPYIQLHFTTYSNFAARCNELSRAVWIYESEPAVNTGEVVLPEEALDEIPSWCSDSADAAERLGLVQGGDVSYDSALTLAEAATLCARIHSLLTVGGTEFTAAEGQAWYAPYTEYLAQQNLFTGQLDWTAHATREQFISLMFVAAPEQAQLTSTGCSVEFADAQLIGNKAAVDAFCMAGIRTGVAEEDGVYFYPDQTITRAEAITIVTRLAEPSLRVGA